MRFVHHTFFHEITNTFGDSIHTETKDDAFAVDHNTHIDITHRYRNNYGRNLGIMNSANLS